MDDEPKNTGKELDIAEDYRRQLQSRFRNEFAGHWMQDDLYNSVVQQMMTISFDCHDQDRISEHERAWRDSDKTAEVKTPLDKAGTHKLVKLRCDEVETVLKGLGVMFGPVTHGSAPTGENIVEINHVPTTESSVITMSEGFMSFCLIISKVFAQTLGFTRQDDHWQASLDPEEAIARVRSDCSLREKWFEMLYAFGKGVGPSAVKHEYIKLPFTTVAYELLIAVERFAIAHEYAHHVMKHRSLSDASEGNGLSTFGSKEIPRSHIEEFSADLMAADISGRIDSPPGTTGILTISGAAAVLVIQALAAVRATRSILSIGAERGMVSETHPSASDRVRILDSLDEYLPEYQQRRFKYLRECTSQIIRGISEMLCPRFKEMHADGVRPIDREPGWLP